MVMLNWVPKLSAATNVFRLSTTLRGAFLAADEGWPRTQWRSRS